MKDLKNLLELRSRAPLSQEQRVQIRAAVAPMLESTNSELLVTDTSMEVTFHPTALCDKIERLCDSIDRLVDMNQALLAYIVDLDGGAPESEMGQSLD